MPRPIGARLKNPAKATEVLANSVVGSLLDAALKNQSGIRDAIALDLAKAGKSSASPVEKASFVRENLSELFRVPQTAGKAIEPGTVFFIDTATRESAADD